MADEKTIAIIGGGAAGLTAAIFAAEAAGASVRVVVVDTAKTLGAKILVSGGGRCNVTHHTVRPTDFNGSQPVVRNVMAAFDAAATVRWFESLGVPLKLEDTGKLFPTANSARAVLNALLNRCRTLGVQFQIGSRVVDIHRLNDDSRFRIDYLDEPIYADRVILATGGRSLPRSGSDGSGWDLVRKLGHTVTPTFAALVPLVLGDAMFHAGVSGLAIDAELSTFVSGKRIDHRRGSLLWTHFGLSGPVVMDASRHWVIAAESGQSPTLRCNLLPGETVESIEKWLVELTSFRPKLQLSNALSAKLPARMATAILAHVGIAAEIICGQLSRDARRALTQALVALPLPVVQQRGWNYAEVTAGGVPLNEIDFRTMQSRKVSGLYLAGELLDCDGRIGGFNFQWAWATGYLAGRAAAKG